MDENEVRMEVDNIVIHPDYNKLVVHDADIALLNVKQPTSNICVQEKVVNKDTMKSYNSFNLRFGLLVFPQHRMIMKIWRILW